MTARRFTRGSPARAVAYVRVSTDSACASAAQQRTAIEAWARREGVEIAAWYEDRGEETGERPGFAAAIEALTSAGAGPLAVASEDRASFEGMSAPFRFAAGQRGARLVTADGSGMPDGTHRCPTCGDPVRLWPRYPRAVVSKGTWTSMARGAARTPFVVARPLVAHCEAPAKAGAPLAFTRPAPLPAGLERASPPSGELLAASRGGLAARRPPRGRFFLDDRPVPGLSSRPWRGSSRR
ncbi:recombinase family protein [Sorangium sp. So ce854]|uniref:recombinase family protein n=1 Tax=Sorangium sp. So ce854 TaxID=3133322 RepID=UPI003F627548